MLYVRCSNLSRRASMGDLPPPHPHRAGMLARSQSDLASQPGRVEPGEAGQAHSGAALSHMGRSLRRVEDFVMVTKGYRKDEASGRVRMLCRARY